MEKKKEEFGMSRMVLVKGGQIIAIVETRNVSSLLVIGDQSS